MKTFSDYYINYYNILKKAIIGFEFEFYSDKSYYKLLESLNREMNPIKVHGFRKYHSSMKPDAENFKIEPDLSGGNLMIELVTGPMPHVDAKINLLKILRLLQENAYTDERCSIHINISFEDDAEHDISELNPLKLILNVDEDYVYKLFPLRENNFYAKSVKRIIPFKGYTISPDVINKIENNLELPDTKYYGINIKNYLKGWLEYRYIGGKDYEYQTKDILELMDYFVLLTWNSLDKPIDEEDEEKIMEYLRLNVNNFKSIESYRDFIAEYPSIKIEVDKNNAFSVVDSYYYKIFDKVFDLVTNTYNLRDTIINYDTEKIKIEVIDGSVKGIFDLRYYNFIECSIVDGTYYRCEFEGSDIKNSHIENCSINDSELVNCKITNSKVDKNTILTDVYFYGGYMDGEMISGVFRGGIIGPNAVIGEDVELVTKDDNYFGGDIEDTYKKDDEKTGKKYGKF